MNSQQIPKNLCRLCLIEQPVNVKMRQINESIQQLFYELTQYKLLHIENATCINNSSCDCCYTNLLTAIDIRKQFITKQIEFERNFNQLQKLDMKQEEGEILLTEEATELELCGKTNVISVDYEMLHPFEVTSQIDEIFESKNILKKQQCSICGSFVRNLSEHLKFTHNQAKKKYFCDRCSYSCYFKTKIERHMQKHVPKKFRNLQQCQECSFMCSRKDALKSHFKTMHQEREKNVPCQHCKKSFYNTSQLNIHIKSVHQNIRNHLCQHCGKGFFTPKDLSMHVQRHFNKTEKCSECNALFYCSVDLRRHIRHKHRPAHVKCEMPNCDRKFHTNSQLKIHIKTRHENVKEYICNHCGANFGQYNNMKRHIDSVHKALRIYCPVDDCSYSITRKDKYKNHLLKAHKNIDEKMREVILKNVKQQ